MATTAETRAPAHLWIVGVLALLWNGFGCFDYLMTNLKNETYLAQFNAEQLAYMDSLPAWLTGSWAIGVWGGLAGSILLLMRSRWAVWSYGLSFVGAVLSLGYQLLLAPPLAGADAAIYKIMPVVIIFIALGLFLYARAMEKKAVLR